MSCYNTSYCTNPCLVTLSNTAACESLPSQIQNFTDAFFGTVIKTEVDGDVVWTLPCNLDVGLPNNPRAEDEGLACYFLRLFNDGIVGLTGPAGNEGDDGAPGRNAYTVLLGGFSQPDLTAPNIQLVTNYNPAIMEGMYVFVDDSGWYLVTNVNISGALNVTLVRLSGGTAVGAWVPSGKLVVPSGYPGASVTGATGAQGIQGPQGTAGVAYTTTNNQVDESDFGAGADFDIPGAMTEVDFVGGGAGEVAVQLLTAGTYLISGSYVIEQAGAAIPVVETELKVQGGAVLAGSQTTTYVSTNVQSQTVSVSVLFYTAAACYVKLRAMSSLGVGNGVIKHDKVCLNYVKLSSAP